MNINRITIKLFIAALTFIIGTTASAVWLARDYIFASQITILEEPPQEIVRVIECTAYKLNQHSADYHAGALQALLDVQNGRLVNRNYGLRSSVNDIIDARLLKDYGIETEIVAGCEVSEQLVEETAGYNDAMRETIVERFGFDAVEKVADDVLAEVEREYADKSF